jgi:hypothetical protein
MADEYVHAATSTIHNNNNQDALEECPLEGPVSARLGCILSYAGSERDMWINYTVLLVNATWCCWVAARNPKISSHYYMYLASLIFVVAFQLGLCLQLGCVGISIIWCAMAAWAWRERQSTMSLLRWLPQGITVAAIIYYLITEPLITTVAHLCALVLGYLLSFLGSHELCSECS